MNIGEAFRVAQCIAQGSLSRFQGGFRAAQPGIGGDKEDGGKAIRAAKKRTEGKANRAAKKKSTLLFARFPPDAWLTETQDTARIECEKKGNQILPCGYRPERCRSSCGATSHWVPICPRPLQRPASMLSPKHLLAFELYLTACIFQSF